MAMDSVFLLGEGERAAFLGRLVRSAGCSYVCLWSYLPQPDDCLLFLDGVCRETSRRLPSSSSGSRARRLFTEYRRSVIYVENGRIPGFAFKNRLPYLELELHDVQRMASSEVQLHFYQAAGIRTVAFMCCSVGEIELGISSASPVDLELKISSMFCTPPPSAILPPANQNQLSSAPSSFESSSFDSTAYLPTRFNIPIITLVPEQPAQEALPDVNPESDPYPMPITVSPQDQMQLRPTSQSTDAAITQAFLAVLSSSTPPSPPPPLQNVLNMPSVTRVRREPSSFQRSLNLNRRSETQVQERRPTGSQLHHVITERRRRKKINESFKELLSFLPFGSKKDKASILSNTIEYINSLESQLEEISRRNQALEAFLSGTQEADHRSFPPQERLHIEISHLPVALTSGSGVLDLRVMVRGESSMLDLLIRILELLKLQRTVTLLSVESNTTVAESVPETVVALGLKIEGDEFDGPAFREAAERALDDAAP